MQNYHIIKALETQEKLRRQYEPLLREMKLLETQEKLRRQYEPLLREMKFIEDFNRQQELMRAACGPLEDINRTISLDQVSQSQLGGEFTQMRDQILAIEQQFRLPEISEATKLLDKYKNSIVSNVEEQYWKQASEFQRSIEFEVKSINTPWLDTANELNSINGFTKVAGYRICTPYNADV